MLYVTVESGPSLAPAQQSKQVKALHDMTLSPAYSPQAWCVTVVRTIDTMQTLQKLIATASSKKSSALQVQEPAIPKRVDVIPSRKSSECYVNGQASTEVSEVKVRHVSTLR